VPVPVLPPVTRMYSPTVVIVPSYRLVDRQGDVSSQDDSEPTTPE